MALSARDVLVRRAHLIVDTSHAQRPFLANVVGQTEPSRIRAASKRLRSRPDSRDNCRAGHACMMHLTISMI